MLTLELLMSQGSIVHGGKRAVSDLPKSLPTRRVTFASLSGRRLVGTLHEGAQPPDGQAVNLPAVVLCHGMESTRRGVKHIALAKRFASGGFDCLRFDFSFVGDSEGDFADLTISGELADAQGALEFMARRGAPGIALVGSSLGGTVAVLAAAKSPVVRALAVIAAVSRLEGLLDRLGREELRLWRQRGVRDFGGKELKVSFVEDAMKTDVLAAAAKLTCPVLITHGSRDRVVPPEDAGALAAAVGANATLELYPQADHRFSNPRELEALLSRIVNWVETTVSKGSASP